ncbi:MAG: hypothetical protein O3A47_00565, partial [Chloroflexi bacterium]|nr:hypothetical protein [Chloroflexota bacterium]
GGLGIGVGTGDGVGDSGDGVGDGATGIVTGVSVTTSAGSSSPQARTKANASAATPSRNLIGNTGLVMDKKLRRDIILQFRTTRFVTFPLAATLAELRRFQ